MSVLLFGVSHRSAPVSVLEQLSTDVREQVATDRPPGIAAVHRELAQRLGDVHEAEHRMLERLGEALWHSQRTGRPPDETTYLESLRQLPGARK